MRAHLGGYFIGQLVTFMYLLQSMKDATQFDEAFWPQFSLYNLVVANFWPAYWLAYFIAPAKLDEVYWHVYDVAQERVTDLFQIYQVFVG